MSGEKTLAPFVHSDGRLRTTWGTMVVIIAFCGGVAMAWAMVRADVARHDDEIKALQNDAHAQREILIRIDERTAEIKRRLDR